MSTMSVLKAIITLIAKGATSEVGVVSVLAWLLMVCYNIRKAHEKVMLRIGYMLLCTVILLECIISHEVIRNITFDTINRIR